MAVSVYLDASVLVALFTEDALTSRAVAFLQNSPTVVVISDFSAAEFASAIAHNVRIGQFAAEVALVVFSTFDAWTAREPQREQLTSADIVTAAAFIRRLDLALRTPDAINIAIAQRIGADLVTFDGQMAAAGRALGMTVPLG
jgi:predicted nucleic acid-binding protein